MTEHDIANGKWKTENGEVEIQKGRPKPPPLMLLLRHKDVGVVTDRFGGAAHAVCGVHQFAGRGVCLAHAIRKI